MKAAKDVLLSPNDFEAETAMGMFVEIYPQEKGDGDEWEEQRPNPRETRRWRLP